MSRFYEGFFLHDIRNTIYAFMADAAATNSNRRRNNRPYQDTSYSPTLFISKTIQKTNATAYIGNVLPTNNQESKCK